MELFFLAPGASGHSQVMAKHGAQKSVLPPDLLAWRKAVGGPRRGCPSWNDTCQVTQIRASARPGPPPPPPLLSSVIGSVGSTEKLLSLGTVLRDPPLAIPRPLPASNSMLPSCFCFSFLYMLSGEKGDWQGTALQPAPPFALLSCSGPL